MSAPIGSETVRPFWKFGQTNQSTDQQTDRRAYREVALPIMYNAKGEGSLSEEWPDLEYLKLFMQWSGH